MAGEMEHELELRENLESRVDNDDLNSQPAETAKSSEEIDSILNSQGIPTSIDQTDQGQPDEGLDPITLEEHGTGEDHDKEADEDIENVDEQMAQDETQADGVKVKVTTPLADDADQPAAGNEEIAEQEIKNREMIDHLGSQTLSAANEDILQGSINGQTTPDNNADLTHESGLIQSPVHKSSQSLQDKNTEIAADTGQTETAEELRQQSNQPASPEEPDAESTPVHERVAAAPERDDDMKNSNTEEPKEVESDSQQTFDVINKKRQEEKEVFQKLIDDVTRLEHEKDGLNTKNEDLNMKIDVCTTELNAEKEKTAEQREKIQQLEGELEAKRSALQQQTETEAHTSSEAQGRPETEEELRDLRFKLKLMVDDDKEKSGQLERLEETLNEYKDLIVKVENEIGKERVDELRNGKNGVATQNGTSSMTEQRANEVSPKSQESQVCTIL